MAVCVGIRVLVEVKVAVGVAVGGANMGVEQLSGNRAKIIRAQNLIMVFITPIL